MQNVSNFPTIDRKPLIEETFEPPPLPYLLTSLLSLCGFFHFTLLRIGNSKVIAGICMRGVKKGGRKVPTLF